MFAVLDEFIFKIWGNVYLNKKTENSKTEIIKQNTNIKLHLINKSYLFL